MSYINVNDIKMYYEDLGRGLPLVLLHGGTGAIEGDLGWSALRPQLSGRFHALFVEYRGHGRTNNPSATLSYEQIASDVCAFITKLDLGPAHIAGMGDGGIVALQIGLAQPELVRSIVCLGVNHTIDKRITRALERATQEANEDGEPDRIAELARLHDTHRWPGYWRVVVKQVVSNSWIKLPFSDEDFQRIARPTLLISGDQDPYGNLDHMVEIKKNIPDSELLVVNNAGHTVQHTHPQLVGPAILDFLDRHPGPPKLAAV